MAKVRLGILGTSWWTEVVWPGFAQAANAEVTWIASRTGEKAREFAERNGIPRWTANYSEVLAAPDVDAVFIGVPNYLHEEMAIAALANGKHVLQEKPMALASEMAVAQGQIAQSRGLVLMVNQELRMADGVRDLPDVITGLGGLKKSLISVTLGARDWSGWRSDPALSGGTLFEMVIHELDLARWLFRRNPLSIYAHGSDTAGQDMTIIIDFGQGDTAVIDVCWRTVGFRMRAECYCPKGWVARDADLALGRGFETITTEGEIQQREFDVAIQGPETFKRVLEGFADSILTGAPVPVSAADGIWAVRMAESARQSLRMGEPIAFPTFM
jgi:D-xylose 1-dehydrogenase (NADP+, D-xylono-1,5-lactone-forming)